MVAAPQYPQLLRALAIQRLGARESAAGTATDWQALSRMALAHRAGIGLPGGGVQVPDMLRPDVSWYEKRPAPPQPRPMPMPRPGQLVGAGAAGEEIRQRLAMRLARTGRPQPAGVLDGAKFMRGAMGA